MHYVGKCSDPHLAICVRSCLERSDQNHLRRRRSHRWRCHEGLEGDDCEEDGCKDDDSKGDNHKNCVWRMIAAGLLIVQMMIVRTMLAANKREKEKGKVPQGMAYSFRVVNSGLVTTLANHRLSDTKGVGNTFFSNSWKKRIHFFSSNIQWIHLVRYSPCFNGLKLSCSIGEVNILWKNMMISITYHSQFENLRMKLCTDITDIKTASSWERCKNTKIQNKWITHVLSAPFDPWSLCAFYHSL